DLDGHIRDLLYDHDCVIVMGLGGFIAHYHPATINESLRFITPPSKRIAFNAALRNNDGLLAHHISYKEKLSYAQACAAVTEYAESIKAELERGGKHKIEKVGVLFSDNSGNTQFLPDTSTNFLPDSFGLPIVQAVPIAPSEELAQTGTNDPAVFEFGTTETEHFEKPVKRLRIMEMIPAAAVLALLVMAPPLIDRFNAHMGSLVPFTRIDEVVSGEQVVIPPMPQIEIMQPENASEVVVEPTIDTVVQTLVTDPVVETPIVDSTTNPTLVSAGMLSASSSVLEKGSEESSSNASSKINYHVIVGSYKNRQNAKRMVKELRTAGIEAEIISRRDGNYLVTVFTADSEKAAENELPAFRTTIVASAWVFESAE
ncbi:MAG: SPOR domain-containing protein, partial [Bacteroidota bacterium]